MLKRYFFRMINPWMATLLRSPLSFLVHQRILVVEYQGRKTGKHYRIPLSYHVCEDRICCLTESSAIWWRNLVDYPGTVDVWLRGKKESYHVAIGDDADSDPIDVLSRICRSSRISAFFSGVRIRGGLPVEADIEQAIKVHALIEFSHKMPQGL